MNKDNGTISFWINSSIGFRTVTPNGTAEPTTEYLFAWGDITNPIRHGEELYVAIEGNRWIEISYNGGICKASLDHEAFDNIWSHIAYTWKDGAQVLYVNGHESQYKQALPTMENPDNDTLRIDMLMVCICELFI